MPTRARLAHHQPAPGPDTLMPTSLGFMLPRGGSNAIDTLPARLRWGWGPYSLATRCGLGPPSPTCFPLDASSRLRPSRRDSVGLGNVACSLPGCLSSPHLASGSVQDVVWGRITGARSGVRQENSQRWREKLTRAKKNSHKEQNGAAW